MGISNDSLKKFAARNGNLYRINALILPISTAIIEAMPDNKKLFPINNNVSALKRYENPPPNDALSQLTNNTKRGTTNNNAKSKVEVVLNRYLIFLPAIF